MGEMVPILMEAFLADYVVLGGGNRQRAEGAAAGRPAGPQPDGVSGRVPAVVPGRCADAVGR